MMSVTNTLAALSVATLLSLGQWLGEGMTAFEKKDYKTAVTWFTKVIEAKSEYNPVKDTALYMRAKCFASLANKKDAVKDLEALLKSGPAEELLKLASADYEQVAGKKWEGDRSSPEATWKTFLAAVQKRDADAVRRCCSGNLLAQLGQALDQPDFFQEIDDEVGPLLSVTYNKAKTRALIVFQEGKRQNRTEELIMAKNDGAWTLASEYSRGQNDLEFGDKASASPQTKVSDDINKLRMLGSACEQYMLEYAKAPAQLRDVAMYIKDFEATRVSSVNGKPFVLAPVGGNQQPWVFTSSAVGGKRVAIVNGSVANYAEAEFRKLAAQHNIKMPQHWRKIKVSKEETAKIQKLIKQLGAGSFKDRKAAYSELQKFGAKAGLQLESAATNRDPEIAALAKKLLAEL